MKDLTHIKKSQIHACCRLHNVVCCQHAAWNAAQSLVIYYVHFILGSLNILWVQPVVQPSQNIDRRQPPIYTVGHKKGANLFFSVTVYGLRSIYS